MKVVFSGQFGGGREVAVVELIHQTTYKVKVSGVASEFSRYSLSCLTFARLG